MTEDNQQTGKIGLALSGGGYRAILFGLGSLIRLNELGILRKLSRITSVSGGSILNAYLAMRWTELHFDNKNVATNFNEIIVQALVDFCSETTISDWFAILNLLNPFVSNSEIVRKRYDELLFHGRSFSTLANISNAPQFLFYGTSFQTGASVRMVDSVLFDYTIGATGIPDWSIATVVGISSAFPPLLSPVIESIGDDAWVKGKFQKYYSEKKFRSEVKLCDGGLYDNLGIECLWKKQRCNLQDSSSKYSAVLVDDIDICLVSDAGRPFVGVSNTKSYVWSQILRLLGVLQNQIGALRKRHMFALFKDPYYPLIGTYWGIGTCISRYRLPKDKPDINTEISNKLQDVVTVLSCLPACIKGYLINWSYVLTDSAIKSHCPIASNPKAKFEWPMSHYPLDADMSIECKKVLADL